MCGDGCAWRVGDPVLQLALPGSVALCAVI
jgi:hypothetical protein